MSHGDADWRNKMPNHFFRRRGHEPQSLAADGIALGHSFTFLSIQAFRLSTNYLVVLEGKPGVSFTKGKGTVGRMSADGEASIGLRMIANVQPLKPLACLCGVPDTQRRQQQTLLTSAWKCWVSKKKELVDVNL